VAVVVAFFICWAPFHTQRLISIYSSPDDVQQRAAASKALQAILFYSSGILYYVSSVINPILYNIMSLKFRRAFKTTLCRGVCGRCCCGEEVNGRVPATAGVRAGARPRGPMAYRFNGDGHVQMLRIDGSDRVCLRRPAERHAASAASAPAKFSNCAAASALQPRSAAVRPGVQGSAANVCDRTPANLSVDAARRGGRLKAVSNERNLYRAGVRSATAAVTVGVLCSRADNAPERSSAPAFVADRTTV